MNTSAARKALLEEKARLQQDIDAIEDLDASQSLSEEAGEASDFGDHPADAGTATFEREKDLALVATAELLMQKVQRALQKLDEGTYGVCDRCDQKIPVARLKALPSATLCLKCQAMEDGI